MLIVIITNSYFEVGGGITMSKRTAELVLLLFFITILFPILSVRCIATFTSENMFVISEHNSQINFATGGSYDSAILENNTWNFIGLVFDSYMLNTTVGGGPYGVVYGREVLQYCPNGGNFSVSTQNCNITITNYDTIMNYAQNNDGWLNYTVQETGKQTFNLHYFPTGIGPWNWTVYIDGESKEKNDGWNTTAEDIITINGANKSVAINFELIQPTKNDEPQDQNPQNPNPSDDAIWFILFIILGLVFSIIIFALKYRRQ
jgi:hypothetical protein